MIFYICIGRNTISLEPSVFQTLLRAARLLGILSMARVCGTRVVWTVHNLQPHKQYHPVIERWVLKTFTGLIDAYFSLSSLAIEQILRQYPALCKKKVFIAPHGHYRGFYRDDLSKREARRKLDVAVSATVIVFFGRISTYKNTPSLIRSFSQLRNEDLVLLIAGKPDHESIAEEISRLAKNDPRITSTFRLHPRGRDPTASEVGRPSGTTLSGNSQLRYRLTVSILWLSHTSTRKGIDGGTPSVRW